MQGVTGSSDVVPMDSRYRAPLMIKTSTSSVATQASQELLVVFTTPSAHGRAHGPGPKLDHVLPDGASWRDGSERLVAEFRHSGVAIDEIRALASKFGDALPGRAPRWVGVSVRGRRDASRAHAEASIALHLGSMLWPVPRVVLYEDVTLFRVLAEQHPDLLRCWRDLLEPLVRYDMKFNGALLATMEMFYEADLSQAKTARLLNVHRHTVNLRLEAAEQILGRTVRTGADRLVLEMACKARRLLMHGMVGRRFVEQGTRAGRGGGLS